MQVCSYGLLLFNNDDNPDVLAFIWEDQQLSPTSGKQLMHSELPCGCTPNEKCDKV